MDKSHAIIVWYSNAPLKKPEVDSPDVRLQIEYLSNCQLVDAIIREKYGYCGLVNCQFLGKTTYIEKDLSQDLQKTI